MPNISRQPILIFDFDGTIADTLRLLIDISNQLADEFRFLKILESDIETLKNKNILEIIQYLKIPVHQMPLIMYKIRQRMRQHIIEAQVAEGLKDVLCALQSQGVRMGILSSNSHSNVRTFLNYNDIECFTFFKTSIGVFGKKQRLKQLLKEQSLQTCDAIYIGDEIRDIEAAHALGIKIAAVSWGYNHPAALAQHRPDYLFRHPRELLELFS